MSVTGPTRQLKRNLLELLRTESAGTPAEWFMVWAELIDDRFYLGRLRRTVATLVRDRTAPPEATQFLREEVMLHWARRLAHPLARAPTAELVESDCAAWIATLIIEDARYALRQYLRPNLRHPPERYPLPDALMRGQLHAQAGISLAIDRLEGPERFALGLLSCGLSQRAIARRLELSLGKTRQLIDSGLRRLLAGR